jgi:hypothetical protein
MTGAPAIKITRPEGHHTGGSGMIDKFKFAYQGTRDQCTVCGDIIDKFEVTAGGIGEDGKTAITICARCLAEPDKINEKLEQHAISAEEYGRRWARHLREFIGQIRNIPSQAQWEAESEFVNAAYGSDLKREQWDSWTPGQKQAWEDHGRDAWHRGDPEVRALVPKIEMALDEMAEFPW